MLFDEQRKSKGAGFRRIDNNKRIGVGILMSDFEFSRSGEKTINKNSTRNFIAFLCTCNTIQKYSILFNNGN